jgi:UDP-xylose:glucoside alpha-1,3-xylosyltransferase
MYMSNCKHAESNGVSVLHGCRSVFHNEKQPVFKAIYQAFKEVSSILFLCVCILSQNVIFQYKFGDALYQGLLSPMVDLMAKNASMPCGRIIPVLIGQLKLYAM